MSEISNAIKQICDEKGLSYDAVIGTIESALAAAYRKDFGQKNQNIIVEYNADTNESKVFDLKTVVEDMPEEELEESHSAEAPRDESQSGEASGDKEEKKDGEESYEEGEDERKFNPKTEIQITDAVLVKKSAKIGDEIKTALDVPEAYGRMAAQTAKQVIIQRLREAERDMVYNDFKDKEHEVVSGVVQRREGRIVLVDLGKSVGVLLADDQIHGEQYGPGDRIKVYVKEVNLKTKGPEILLSRTSEEILKKVLYLEIPEISNGLIDLKSVAREAGSRSKIAVFTDSDNVDPIGSCVGQRGARIQTIINELGGEKVDIIEWDDDPASFISNSLSPAKIISIDIDEKETKAIVKVAPDQLSLAIGKGGQNARLAAKLTGWKIDIVGVEGDEVIEEVKSEDGEEKESHSAEAPRDKSQSGDVPGDEEEKVEDKEEAVEKVEEVIEEEKPEEEK